MSTTRRTRLRQSRVAQFLLVGLLLVGVLAAVPAAGQLLAGDGSDYVQNFEANESDYINYTVESDGADFSADSTDTIYMNVTYNGVEHLSVSQDVAGSDVNKTFNRTHDELNTVPGAPNENTTVDVNAWGEASNGTVTTSVSNFKVDIGFNDTRSVAYVENTSAATITVDEFEPGFLTKWVPLYGDEDQPDTYEFEETRSVANDTTDIIVHLADSDLESGFDHEADDYSGSGDPILGMTATVDGSIVPVFNSQKGSNYVGSNDTYAVYNDDAVTFVLGGEHSDADSVDVTIRSQNPLESDDSRAIEDVESAYGDELTVTDLRSEFSTFEVGIIRTAMDIVPFGMVVGGLALLPVAIGRRRRTEE